MAHPVRVSIEVPSAPEMLRLLRLSVASLCADAGLSIERVEAARTAVSELAAAVMIRTNPGAKLTVHLTLDGCRLRVDGSAATNGDGHDGEVAMPGAVRSLLAMSTDEWDFSASGGRAHFAFVVSPSASMR